MHHYSTIPRAMNFGHSPLDAWNAGFEDVGNVYHTPGSTPPLPGQPSVHDGQHSSSHSHYPSQRPLHTTQPLQTTAYQSSSQPQSWPSRYSSYEPAVMSQQYIDSYTQPSPFVHNVPPYNTQSYPSQSSYLPSRQMPTLPSPSNDHASEQRLSMAGSLDPSTGIFYRTPEHPRLRTAQACEKCRIRKAKCSGEHPSCKRCLTRGLICEYAKEGRVRGPNKPKKASRPTGDDGEGSGQRPSSRQRGSVANSTPSPTASSAHPAGSSSMGETPSTTDVTSDPSTRERYRPRRSSLSAHRSERPRPPHLSLDTSSPHLRLPSDPLDLPNSSISSGSHPRSGSSQLSSGNLIYDYHSADDERSLSRNYFYPETSEGSHSK
ncbi:hypothetical protein CPB85DRAFT_1309362 [Mucidula mucida]|nr:hypothetical protein CPB85DRAFT_1309362 [Mucidula mucida]